MFFLFEVLFSIDDYYSHIRVRKYLVMVSQPPYLKGMEYKWSQRKDLVIYFKRQVIEYSTIKCFDLRRIKVLFY
jgi:hypothetical protein